MAKKNSVKKDKEIKKKKINHQSNLSQTPLKTTQKEKTSINKSQKLQQFKSRSHSPAPYSYSPKPKTNNQKIKSK